MENNFKGIVHLPSDEAFQKLFINGSLETSEGTITYSPNDTIYTTPETSNSNCVQKNYLINPQFKVNQRGNTIYESTTSTTSLTYTADRWIKPPLLEAGYSNDKFYIKNLSTSESLGIGQFIYDHEDLLGNVVTVTVSTNLGNYTFTFDALPADTTIIEENTTIQSFETDFGLIELVWFKSHFMLRISLNPATETTDSILTLYFAKLELGTKFSGFLHNDYTQDLIECMKFYQNPFVNGLFYPATCLRFATQTAYYVNADLFCPMVSRPVISDKSDGRIQIVENGLNATWKNYNSFSVGTRSTDHRQALIVFTFNEDNTGILGNSNSQCFWASVKTSNIIFESEIYS